VVKVWYSYDKLKTCDLSKKKSKQIYGKSNKTAIIFVIFMRLYEYEKLQHKKTSAPEQVSSTWVDAHE
jgi:hypothetical protein